MNILKGSGVDNRNQCTPKKCFNARCKWNPANSDPDRSDATVIMPGVQGVFLHLHCSLFLSASSCFSFLQLTMPECYFSLRRLHDFPSGMRAAGWRWKRWPCKTATSGWTSLLAHFTAGPLSLTLPLSPSRSLSLSLTHTHTHTHTNNGLQEIHWRLWTCRRKEKERWR